jgi:dolichol-phosphate mannosyltransferase
VTETQEASPASVPARRSFAGRISRFLLVGASGLVVNQGLLMLLHGSFQWPLALASPVAVECSILTNYTLNSLWTWREHLAPGIGGWLRRGLQYHVVTLAAGVTNVVGVLLLSKRLGMDFRIANLVSIAAGSAVTYLVSDHWVFRRLR